MKKPDQCTRCLAGSMKVTASKKLSDDKRKLWLKCTNRNCGHKETRVIDEPEAPADGQ
jgi:hypothetical protein